MQQKYDILYFSCLFCVKIEIEIGCLGQRSLVRACSVAGYIDHVISWRVQFSFRAGFCRPFSSPPALPLGLLGFFSTDAFVSVMGACSFSLVWGLMAGLRCCASHGGIISV